MLRVQVGGNPRPRNSHQRVCEGGAAVHSHGGGGVEDENMFYVLHPQVHQERIAQPLEGGKPQLVLEAARVLADADVQP